MTDSAPKKKPDGQRKPKKSLAKCMSYSFRMAYKFITVDMWRIFPDETTGVKGKMTNTLRVLYITIAEFIEGNTMRKSAALTYSTILSIVPLLAILISIAAAFGVQETVQQQLYEYLPAHRLELSQGLEFAQKYIAETKGGGLFIGIGVIFLLWAVISLLSSIEDTINDVWQIKEARSWSRRILGYLAAFILLPVLMTLSSGINIFISSLGNVNVIDSISLTPIVTLLLHVVSFCIVIGIFTTLFLIFPNTRVHFSSALIGGTVAGIGFSLFQWVYISGMLWVTKYNAIYGSFAAIPLLLMYINFSWVICLFGAHLSYAIENTSLYLFRAEKDNVSRRFQDFVALILMKKIATAFKSERSKPYSIEGLSKESRIPITVVRDMLNRLVATGLIREIPNIDLPRTLRYMPNVDIHTISVQKILHALDTLGFENLSQETYKRFDQEWQTILATRDIRKDEAVMQQNILDI